MRATRLYIATKLGDMMDDLLIRGAEVTFPPRRPRVRSQAFSCLPRAPRSKRRVRQGSRQRLGLQLYQQHLGVRPADVLPDVSLGRDPRDVAGVELPIPAGSVGQVEAPVKGAQRVQD